MNQREDMHPPASGGAATAPQPVLEVTGVEKRFGGVRALRGAHMTITAPGVVHSLVGENGSGKSTLLGILSGQLRPDAGCIRLDGVEVRFGGPTDALRHGIAMVSQETALALDLSVAENIFMGHRMAGTAVGIDWPATHARARDVLEGIGLDYDPAAPVRSLRPDQRQMVEIARSLSMNARILILDEPTSALTDDEVAALFAAVRELQTHGVATIFVSHRLKEVFDLATEVTVLRDGNTVDSASIERYDPDSLVAAMVGGAEGSSTSRATSRGPGDAGRAPVLSVRGLTGAGVLADVDLDVGAGEIVGVAGLVGAGRSELLRAIFGDAPVQSGTITLRGQALAPGAPSEAISHGIGFLPPDRKVEGLVLKRSVAENIAMVVTLAHGRLRSPRAGLGDAKVDEMVAAMRIATSSSGTEVGTLSGGNQQKVALGKWLAADPSLLLLDEPTRGVDVAAKTEIHNLLRAAAERGMALLVSSSETPELLALCHRIIVMFRGRVVAVLSSDEATEGLLARYGGGHTQDGD